MFGRKLLEHHDCVDTREDRYMYMYTCTFIFGCSHIYVIFVVHRTSAFDTLETREDIYTVVITEQTPRKVGLLFKRQAIVGYP